MQRKQSFCRKETLHLTTVCKFGIDRYHAAAFLNLKRGWTGMNNMHIIFRMYNLF